TPPAEPVPPAGAGESLTPAAVPSGGFSTGALPANAASDAVFADYASLPASAGLASAPVVEGARDGGHAVDLSVIAGLTLGVGGSWSTLARAEETRKISGPPRLNPPS